MFRISNQTEHYSYDPEKTLGRGATAAVYRGHRKRDGQPCAVKVLTRDAMTRMDVVKRELEVLSKYSHPNIVEVFAIEKDVSTLPLPLSFTFTFTPLLKWKTVDDE